ncbi:unnamed protein product [Linum trigynum]|uniref:Uncharacterized protein n=1 Tax=Linum trigynum TaxID=586398 RepID=A0AAV2DEV7_9ROSI
MKENAAATVFSLSPGDENKIIIGASGAIPALVELLEQGSSRGKKDVASTLFNLCIYQGNKGRAVRAGIVPVLLRMLADSRGAAMVDEALTILSVLSSNAEAKAAIVKVSTIPVLIDLLRIGQPRGRRTQRRYCCRCFWRRRKGCELVVVWCSSRWSNHLSENDLKFSWKLAQMAKN